MPVKSCRQNDLPGFKWGDAGKCYTYKPGDKESKTAARTKAVEQGRAIESSRTSSDDE